MSPDRGNRYTYREILSTLEGYLSTGRLPHAFLFLGEQGLGKQTLARWFAGEILALGKSPQEGERARELAQRERHPDLTVTRPPGGPRSFHMEAVREIVEGLYLAPQQSLYRVYLLAQCHWMTPQAQNALLKALEEPPDFVVFLLTCDHRDSLLPTVLSRCYCLELSPLSQKECLDWLGEHYPQEKRENLEQAAFFGKGNLGKCGQLLTGQEEQAALQGAMGFLEGMALGEEYRAALALAPLEKNRNLALMGLELVQELLGGILREKNGVEENPPSRVEELAKALSLGRLLEIYDQAGTALEQVKGNVGAPLALESLCARLFSQGTGR